MRRPASCLFALLLTATALPAQSTQEVTFAPGNYGTMVTGSITGQDYADYTLAARAGQEMFVDLSVTETDGNGSINLNILPPGSDNVALYNGSMEGNTATVPLPETGVYTIRVYLMGNDEDTGRTVAFTLDLSIQ